ncbi:exodeoxyribonuclease III [Azospirillaceae bacterium]
MRIISWNINSVRLRLDLLEQLIEQTQPDVLCLQETKTTDDAFPRQAFHKFGYPHQLINGMKGYNGVAILSRLPLKGGRAQNWCGRKDCRHLLATLPNGVELHNVYVPSGGQFPVTTNEKFVHKLQFLDEMTAWWPKERTSESPIILVGDLNIAPLENDVWSHKEMIDVISHTSIEIEKLSAMQNTIGWVDVGRHFVPPEKKLYTWWSYRAHDWMTSNRGRRLDHIWVTSPLVSTLNQFSTIQEARGWLPKPSDHIPVIVDIAL